MATWLHGEVVENHAWNNELFSLRVRTEPFEFTAGQFVRLGLEHDGRRLQRAYSLVNAPHAELLDFLVNRVHDGEFSPRLHALQPGSVIQVSQPASGFFTLAEVPEGDSLWLMATGTGIGPYFSMLETPEPWQRFARINLVYAVRYEADLAYLPLIQSFQQKYPQQFRFQPIVSREQSEGALQGRIPALIAEGQLQRALDCPLDASAQVMLCGNPEMIRDARSLLAEMGLPKNLRRKPGNVTVEHYW